MNKYTCLIVEDSNIEREGLRYLLELSLQIKSQEGMR